MLVPHASEGRNFHFMLPPLIEVVHRKGIYLPEADLWLDPHFGVKRAFISHAHSDHVARHSMTFCSETTRDLMKVRYGYKDEGEMRALPMREVIEWEGWELRLLPAGHIIGSAMLHLTRKADGATLLYTGDYKLRQGLSSERCELIQADTLIMECTFGLPHYVFPPTSQTVAAILQFVQETIEDGGIPVLLGYSLGKAQEILCALAEAGHPVMVHKSIWEMTRAVAPLLGKLPEYELFDASRAKGHVLLFPPSNGKSLVLKKLKVCRTAMLTGWAMNPGARFRYQVDEIFPLSDHADHPELLETVDIVQPRRVWLVHGYTREFAAELRARGVEAWTLERDDQLELPITGAKAEIVATAPTKEEWGEGSFAEWARVCSQTAEVSSRLKKIDLLANFLRGLDDEDLQRAATFSSGSTGEGAVNTGWALIKRALMELSQINEAEYRAISRSQADAGRTAYLVLQRATLVTKECGLRDVAHLFQRLRQASSQMERVSLLRDRLQTLSATTGSWLVRLLTGELRMGSREGLIEESIATAFEQSADDLREASMLCGDIGAAALLAKQNRLKEATPQVFVPIKVMLASPEETSEDIWKRLQLPRVWLEDKYDGIRAQVHLAGGRAEIFTRDLKLISSQFPEICQAMQLLSDEVIVDGEIIAHAEGKKLTFFDLQKRLGRRDQADLFLPSEVSVKYVIFDLLWRNGASLLHLPLEQRRAELEALSLPKGIERIEVITATSAEEIEAAFLAARRRGNEGLIAKDAASIYSPGRRGKSWLKLKKAFATLDVVVVKAEQGHGKRSHVLSDYTFAVRDEASGNALRVIGKAYSGLTDAEIEELTEHFTQTTLSEKGRVRTVKPEIVLEIAFDSIQPSDRHDSGLAMRFPRIKAIRRDKSAHEIDTLAYAMKLAGVA
jgi:DNA ligase 1